VEKPFGFGLGAAWKLFVTFSANSAGRVGKRKLNVFKWQGGMAIKAFCLAGVVVDS